MVKKEKKQNNQTPDESSLSFQLIRLSLFTSIDSEYEQLLELEKLWTRSISFPSQKMHHVSCIYQVEYVWWWHTGEERCHYAVIIQHAAAERHRQLYGSARVCRDDGQKQTAALCLRGAEFREWRKHPQQKPENLKQPTPELMSPAGVFCEWGNRET